MNKRKRKSENDRNISSTKRKTARQSCPKKIRFAQVSNSSHERNVKAEKREIDLSMSPKQSIFPSNDYRKLLNTGYCVAQPYSKTEEEDEEISLQLATSISKPAMNVPPTLHAPYGKDRRTDHSNFPAERKVNSKPTSLDGMEWDMRGTIHSSNLIGNKRNIQSFADWLKARKSKQPKTKRAAFVHGPVGSGKTTAVWSILQEYGYIVQEINSATINTRDTLAERIRKIATTSSLTKPTAVVVEEIDAIAAVCKVSKQVAESRPILEGEESPAAISIGEITSMLNRLPASSSPIVFVCSNRNNKVVRQIAGACHQIPWWSPQHRDLANFAKNLCIRKGIFYGDTQIERFLAELITESHGDIRKVVQGIDAYIVSKRCPNRTNDRTDMAELLVRLCDLEGVSLQLESSKRIVDHFRGDCRKILITLERYLNHDACDQITFEEWLDWFDDRASSSAEKTEIDPIRDIGCQLAPYKAGETLIFSRPNFSANEAHDICIADESLAIGMVQENFPLVFGPKDIAGNEKDPLVSMTKNLSDYDVTCQFAKPTNHASLTVGAWSTHVLRDKRIQTPGKNSIVWPTLLSGRYNQFQKTRKNIRTLLSKLTSTLSAGLPGGSNITDFSIFLRTCRLQLERYDSLDPRGQSALAHCLHRSGIHKEDVESLVDRSVFSYSSCNSDSDKPIDISIGYGGESLLSRIEEYDKPIIVHKDSRCSVEEQAKKRKSEPKSSDGPKKKIK
jgi:hypothetical protein